MGKYGTKNKLKVLNEYAKHENATPSNASNKVVKKKLKVEKKVSFQKKVFLKEISRSRVLVKRLSTAEIALMKLFRKPDKGQVISTKTKTETETEIKEPKIKAVEKQKKRQKTQISDTKLLLNLMKKKI